VAQHERRPRLRLDDGDNVFNFFLQTVRGLPGSTWSR
jgi:hypothetical protein